jgi:hypothetical protein
MTKTGILALCALEMTFATTAYKAVHTKAVTARDVRPITPLGDGCRSSFICRQDLFDRNNPNNIRSDWPGPPAQPGRF